MNTNKTLKMLGILALTTGFSLSSLMADVSTLTEEDIAKLSPEEKQEALGQVKVEIEALEKEQERLKRKAKMERRELNGAFGFCKGQHASTGCFIGASVGLAFGENWMPPFSTGGDNIGSQTKNFVAVPVNIDLGWQWYYAQNAGFRFKGYVGYSYYGTKFDETRGILTGAMTFDTSIHAIQYGLEASYLYDHLQRQP